MSPETDAGDMLFRHLQLRFRTSTPWTIIAEGTKQFLSRSFRVLNLLEHAQVAQRFSNRKKYYFLQCAGDNELISVL